MFKREATIIDACRETHYLVWEKPAFNMRHFVENSKRKRMPGKDGLQIKINLVNYRCDSNNAA